MKFIFVFTIGFILFMIINVLLSNYKFYKGMSILKRVFITVCISIMLSFLIFNLYVYILIKIRYNLLLKGMLNSLPILILVITSFYIGLKFIYLLNDNIIKEDNLNNLNNKIEHKDNIIAKLRSQKHDYLKHLQVVYSLLNSNLNEDAKDYITNISNSFRSKTSRYGKVSYLDAISALKYEECLLKNISFDVYIQDFIDNLSISPDEMSSVLLNIIDNAIDSLCSISKENKYIKLFVYEDEFQYVISIKNNGPKIYNTDSVFLEGFSTKDGQDRGYGLYLVKNILDKYGYHIFANSDDFLTEFTILIPKYC